MRKHLTLIAALLAILGIVLLIASSFGLYIHSILAQVTAKEQKLVYQTDHAALLAACRQIMADPQAFGADKDGWIEGPWGGARTENPKLPPAIRALDFEGIHVDSDSKPPSIEILFGGGFYHFGFGTPTTFRGGIEELIPGLWYWNESGRLPPDPAKWRFPTLPTAFVSSWLLIAGGIVLLIWNRRNAQCPDLAPPAGPSPKPVA